MKKILISLTSAILALSSFSAFNSNAYDGKKASNYAKTYYHNYNRAFYNYNDAGGDCTNFVSQCLQAGGYKQDKEGTNFFKAGLNQNWEKTKWYHKSGITVKGEKTWDVSTTWANVTTDHPNLWNGLYQYLTSVKGNKTTIYGLNNTSYKNLVANASVGDVIQLEGSGKYKEHSLIISDINTKKGEVYVSSHSIDYFNKPFSEIITERRLGKNNYINIHLIKVR